LRKHWALLIKMAGAFAFAPSVYAEETPATSAIAHGSPVVFVLPRSADAALEKSLREALEAQFSGMQASLIFRTFDSDLPDLRSQARAARDIARALSARAVFWVEAAAGQEMLLYLSEPEAERILVRRLQTGAMSADASAEMVSIITRESTAALLAGHTIGMQPVQVEPPPAPPPPVQPPAERPVPPKPRRSRPRSVPPRSGLSVDIGYQGNAFAPQEAWQNAVHFAAHWLSASGIYAGASYDL
jgi:hypothetical protein